MRISDWSSDVCSSDLDQNREILAAVEATKIVGQSPKLFAIFDIATEENIARGVAVAEEGAFVVGQKQAVQAKNSGYHRASTSIEIGRATWRERVCTSVEI